MFPLRVAYRDPTGTNADAAIEEPVFSERAGVMKVARRATELQVGRLIGASQRA